MRAAILAALMVFFQLLCLSFDSGIHLCSSQAFFRLFSLDALIDFFPVHRDIPGRIDANPYLVAFDTQHSNSDVITNHQGFTNPASQYQHDYHSPNSIVPFILIPESGYKNNEPSLPLILTIANCAILPAESYEKNLNRNIIQVTKHSFLLNRILKKSFHGFFQFGKAKMRFCLSSIFNDRESLKIAAHLCAATDC
jgi:hypothetical protein